MDFFDCALLIELLFIAGVVSVLSFRESDWTAYMEVVGSFLDGELSYTKLKGDNERLAYPGGFIWIYTALYYITRAGRSISLAQLIFSGLYLITFGMILSLYRKAHFPWWITLPLILAPGIVTNYTLSLANDCWAIFFLYSAITLFAGQHYWKLGCLLYSMSVSVKLSMLSLAPGLLHVLLCSLSFPKVISCLVVWFLWQALVAYPFFLNSWQSYMNKGFELEHIFTYECSLNHIFLPQVICVPSYRQYMLLFGILAVWLLVFRLRWRTRRYKTVKKAEKRSGSFYQREEACNSHMIVLTLFESAVMSISFMTLRHCVLYNVFFHMLPYTLYNTKYPNWLKCLLLGLLIQGFEISSRKDIFSILSLAGVAMLITGILLFGDDIHTETIRERETNKSMGDRNHRRDFLY